MDITKTFVTMEDLEMLLRRVSSLERAVGDLRDTVAGLDTMTVSQREAAERMGLNEKTIRRYREIGLITPVPGTTRYSLSEIRRFTNAHMDNGKKL